MPKDFERCIKRGGKVRTVDASSKLGKKLELGKGSYTKVCFLGGKMFVGEEHSHLADAIGKGDN